MRLCQVTGDGHQELLITYPDGADSTALQVYQARPGGRRADHRAAAG